MGLIHKDMFVCLDCETTGLDPENDHIIELAICKFTFDEILESREDLIDPGVPIPQQTTKVHHITDEMVMGKPCIKAVLSHYLRIIDHHVLVGHGIPFDIAILKKAAERSGIEADLSSLEYLDTLRMARLYGESPTNSLESLCQHFNIEVRGAHRAMNDVIVNIDVFKHLSHSFETTEKAIERFKDPIQLKVMPLGKYKGRAFSDIPQEYLWWAAHQNFDADLLFSIHNTLKKRRSGNLFSQATNPFLGL